MLRRPPVLFVAWTSRSGRADDIARALQGKSVAIFPRWLTGRRLTPLRYLISAALTWLHLLRHRPHMVIVTNPPVFAGLAAWSYCRMAGVPMVLDSHPTSFGAKDHRVSQRLLPLHRWLVRRATLTLVTTQQWVDVVAQWGGRGTVVHEPPPAWSVGAAKPITDRRPQVLFIGIFGGDEPVAELLEAAQLVPQVDIAITGDVRRCPPHLRARESSDQVRSRARESSDQLRAHVLPNVTFTGYLHGAAYAAAIEDADAVVALTTEPTSVMRAAYEAVYAERPLVISDTPILRVLFPSAVFVANTAPAIAAGIQEVVRRHEQLRQAALAAHLEQLERWRAQLEQLQHLPRKAQIR